MSSKVAFLTVVVILSNLAGGAWAVEVNDTQNWGETDLSGQSLTIGPEGDLTINGRVNIDNGTIVLNGGRLTINGDFHFADRSEDGSPEHIYLYGGTMTVTYTECYRDRGAAVFVGGGEMITGQVTTGPGPQCDPSNSEYWDIRLLEGYGPLRIDDIGEDRKKIWAAPTGPSVQFESAASGAVESAGPAAITVVLNRPADDEAYTVDYAVTGGTATGGGVDYLMAGECDCDLDDSGQVDFRDIGFLVRNWLSQTPGNIADINGDNKVNFEDFGACALKWLDPCGGNVLQFGSGQTIRTISIEIVNDGIDEEDETIEITLSNPTGGDLEIGPVAQHVYTIIDPRPAVGFASAAGTGAEDVSPASIDVVLTAPVADVVTVDYRVIGGTAEGNGVDYADCEGTLVFDPCDVNKTINIDIVNDTYEESFETIELLLSNPTNAKLANTANHTFTIVDDEMGPAYTNSIGMEFVQVTPGSFMMGSNDGDYDERPVHNVTISRPFYIGRYEVTNSQYEQFDPDHAQLDHYGFSHGPDEAVIMVSWEDANSFCEWLSAKEGRPYRLPTEAEWEYACRAGTTTRYNTGDDCECDKNQDGKKDGPDPVGLNIGNGPPNAWGLYDMHGNVEEWCSDWYGPYQPQNQTDPVGRAVGSIKVSRGGSHGTTRQYLRSANRMGTLPQDSSWMIGFRVAIGEMPTTEPLGDAPLQRYQTDVSQQVPPDVNQGPDPCTDYFHKREYVHIPGDLDDGPLYSEHNHVPAITTCPNGDLLATWYSVPGTEVSRVMGVAVSRLRYGHDQWEPASLLWDAPDRNDHTTAMWTDETGKIYHFQGVSEAAWFRYLALFYRTSTDNGVTWSQPSWISLKRQPCQMPCESVFRTQSGSIVLACDARYDGDPSRSAIWVSDDNGMIWYNPAPEDDKGTIGGIHACVAELSDGRLLAYGRGGDVDDTMPKSISSDMGQSWSIGASQFPGIGSRQRSVLMRLKEGPLLLVSFDSDGIFATVSLNQAQSWQNRKYLTSDEKGYLAGTQSADGLIHIVASIVDEHYSFNLKWLYDDYKCD